MSVKLLTEHHLEFRSLKGSCTGSSESTLVKMNCLKSHVTMLGSALKEFVLVSIYIVSYSTVYVSLTSLTSLSIVIDSMLVSAKPPREPATCLFLGHDLSYKIISSGVFKVITLFYVYTRTCHVTILK